MYTNLRTLNYMNSTAVGDFMAMKKSRRGLNLESEKIHRAAVYSRCTKRSQVQYNP